MSSVHSRRRVCFVTGTRAEFGLMETTLRAIREHASLELQIVATGMHVDRSRGYSLRQIKASGFHVDEVVPWKSSASPTEIAERTGAAITRFARTFDRLSSDLILVVGDRVEAFAAASAAAVSGRIVAHVHGGDRALGQIDDSLRHAITKLAHVHFAATEQSRNRIVRLGEDSRRVHRVGAPGIDGIRTLATKSSELCPRFQIRPKQFALLAYHPASDDDAVEYRRAKLIVQRIAAARFERGVVICPNNDAGSNGIMQCWRELEGDSKWIVVRDLARKDFLGLMRDAAILIGNSSSGIIEAASFGTPVIDIGDRQLGRERSANVRHATVNAKSIDAAIRSARSMRQHVRNVYGGVGTGQRIARILASISIDDRLRRKLITY